MVPHDVFVFSFICQGFLVLLSYCIYWPEDPNIWAGLKDPLIFYIWCVSATLSAVGFCGFSVELIMFEDQHSMVYIVTPYPYALFLLSAAMYMPLVLDGQKAWVIFFLFLAALSTCVLVYCSVSLFGWNWVTILMFVLAFHCTVVDLIYWGFTWVRHEPQVEHYESESLVLENFSVIGTHDSIG